MIDRPPFCPRCGLDQRKTEPITIGEASFDPGRGFSYAGVPISLAPCQRILIFSLMTAGGRIVADDTLIERMGIEGDDQLNTLRQQMFRMRKKLKAHGAARHIKTSWKLGYRWEADLG